ncbi:TonB-dependent receptor plug domain-containing protein, partial [Pedobacter sp.]
MRKLSPILIFICCFLTASYLRAQTPDTIAKLVLDSVVINAYGSGALMVTPAAINKIGTAQLQRYANTNILQAVNSTAGVSMEERSLGSYRLNIRGSSVRSPYGVRNVKVYYDNIPFTAPGGNTMLNMLGFYNVGALEIIKGPGSSLYGAGTGGIVLFEAPGINGSTNVEAGLNAGTYGTLAYHSKIQLSKHIFSYEDTRSEGYREHTQMNRKVASYQT